MIITFLSKLRYSGQFRYQVLMAETEGFGPYRTCTVFVSCSLRCARYTQTFLIPHGNCSSSFLVSSVHSLRSFTAETEGFEPSEPFKGLTSLAKRHVRPLRHVSNIHILARYIVFSKSMQ